MALLFIQTTGTAKHLQPKIKQQPMLMTSMNICFIPELDMKLAVSLSQIKTNILNLYSELIL